jgi:hypothetical protein
MLKRALALILAFCLGVSQALASQATLVTPSAPLPMTGLASFLNSALLSVGSQNSGSGAPANGTGGAAFAGESWCNTSASTWVCSLYDGANWDEFGTVDSTGHRFTPFMGAAITSGGIPYGASASTIGWSSALTQFGFVVGGGAGGAPGAVLCGDAQLAYGQTSANPACASSSGDITNNDTGVWTIGSNKVTNVKLATASQNTVKGAATSTAEADLAVPSCSTASSALSWTTNTGFGCNTISGSGTLGTYTLSHSTGAWVCTDPTGATVNTSGTTTSGLQECINAMQTNKTGALRAVCPLYATPIVASTPVTIGPSFGYLYDLNGCHLQSTASTSGLIIDTLAQGSMINWPSGAIECALQAGATECVLHKPTSADPVFGGYVPNQNVIRLPYVLATACSGGVGSLGSMIHLNSNFGTAGNGHISAIADERWEVAGIDGNASLRCASFGWQNDNPTDLHNGIGQNVFSISSIANFSSTGIIDGSSAVTHSTQALATNTWYATIQTSGSPTSAVETFGFQSEWHLNVSVNTGTLTNCIVLGGGGTQTTPTGASDNVFIVTQLSGCTNPYAVIGSEFRNATLGPSNVGWRTYTPTIACGSGTITTLGTVTGRYQVTNRMMTLNVSIPITTIGTCATYVSFTLPQVPVTASVLYGRETQATGIMLQANLGATATIGQIQSTTGTCVNGTAPCNSGDTLVITGSYELQ